MDYEKDSIPSFIVGDDAYSVRNRLYGTLNRDVRF